MALEEGEVDMAEKEGIASRYWKKHKDDSRFVLLSPFFVSLTSGILDSESFGHFISHDLHFLRAFLAAYEVAEDCVEDKEDKSKIRGLRENVNELHNYHIQTIVPKWGLKLPQQSILHATTVKYRDFLRKTSSGEVEGVGVPCKTKVAAYILAATAPITRLYGHLFHTIITDLSRYDLGPLYFHSYRRWLEYYTSNEIEALAQKTEKLLDKLSVSLTEEELQVTEKLYDQAMMLQLEYFASQTTSRRKVIPLSRVHKSQLTIFSNFDMTCWFGKSTTLLTKLALLKPVISPQTSVVHLAELLEDLSARFEKGVAQCVKDIPSNVGEGLLFDYDRLSEFLKPVAEYDKRENARADDWLLKGISNDVLKLAGQSIKLHKGCREFFQKIVKIENPRIDVHVISYCWSGDLIRSAVSPDLEALNIHSNELVYEESVTTGQIVKIVESPFDKLHAFNNILEGYKSTSTSEDKHIKVYIGHELGDILCLLEADIGIVFDSSTSDLWKVGKYFGVKFVPLRCGVVRNYGVDDWKLRCGILYTVKSWAEIEAFIFGF